MSITEEAKKLLKKSQVEILLSSIKIDKDGSTVYPTNCPGIGRAKDVLLDEEGSAACIYKGKRCNYFIGADFALEDYTKSIDCRVDEL